MSGYKNKAFDKLRNQQRGEMDRDKRREILWGMQQYLLEDVPEYLSLLVVFSDLYVEKGNSDNQFLL